MGAKRSPTYLTGGGGFDFEDLAQADASATPAAEAQPKQHAVTVSAVADAGGKPLKGVKIWFHGRIAAKIYDRRAETDERGFVSVQWPRGATINNLWMDCRRDGHVPIHYTWRSEIRPIEMPERIDLRLVAGQTIGGIVQSEVGAPIAGANVEITMPVTWPKLDNYVFQAADPKTDDKGRWTWPSAPRDLGACSIRVKHPDFMEGTSTASSEGQAIAVLKRGLEVAGQIVDTNGKPIVGAKARLGFDRFGTGEPEATSDANGRFVIKKCKPGKSLVTVQADGFSPTFRDVHVGENGPTTDVGEFKLDPGHTLRVRVIDPDGKPVQGAFFASDTWRNHRSLEFRVDTDAKGQVVWKSAPDDEVLCDIGKEGYMSVRKISLKAGEKEHVVTLPPRMVVRGTVVDAATKNPLPEFGIRRGYLWSGRKEPSLSGDAPVPYVDGRFDYSFDEPIAGAYVLQAVAPGYLPATSRPIRSDEGNVTIEFALPRGEGLAGTVLEPNGKPVAKASVGLG